MPFSSNKRTFQIALLLFLIGGIFLTLYLVKQQQENRGRAQEGQTHENAKERRQKEEEKRLSIAEKKNNIQTLNLQIEALTQNKKEHPNDKEKTQKDIVDLTKDRKEEVLSMLSLHPEEVSGIILPEDVRNELEAIPDAEVEREVSLTGTFLHTHIDNFDSPEDTQFFNRLITNDSSYLLYSTEDLHKLDQNTSVTIKGFQIDKNILVDEAAQNGSRVLGAATSPPVQKVAVIASTFSDTAQTFSWDMNAVRTAFEGIPGQDVKSFFNEVSYGKNSVTASYFGNYQLSLTKAACSDHSAIASAAITAADNDIDFRNFNRLVFLIDCSDVAGEAGLQENSFTTNDGVVSAARAWMGPNAYKSAKIYSHELGHNMNALPHSNFYLCLPDSFRPPYRLDTEANCVSREYGDIFDTMSADSHFSHFNAYFKSLNNWLGSENYKTVSSPGTYTFTLAPLETPSSTTQALYIPRGTSNTGFLVEYRQPIGIDAWFTTPVCKDCTITKGPAIKFIGSGSSNGIDTTPYSRTSRSYYPAEDFYNGAALEPGNTFNDPEFGISIRTLSADAAGTTVEVNIPPGTCTRNAPTVAISPSIQSASAGTPLRYTATVTNTDSSGCTPTKFGPGKAMSDRYTYLYPNLLSLAPGGSGTITFDYTFPTTSIVTSTPNSITIYSDATDGKNGSGNFTSAVSAPADTTPPSKPTNVVATVDGPGQITLSWNPSTDNTEVAGYTIYRDGSVSNPLPATQTTFTQYQLPDNKTYSYTIEAFDRRSNRTKSDVVTATTPVKTDTQAPTARVTFTSSFTKSNEVQLSWSPATDNLAVTGYQIFVNGGGRSIQNQTNITLSNLRFSTKYEVLVQALDAAGNGSSTFDNSYIFYTAKPNTLPPTPPTNLVVTPKSPFQVDLSWAPSIDDQSVVGYDIYHNNFKLTTTTGTTFSHTGLIDSSTHEYFIQAVDNDGNQSGPTARVWGNTPGAGASPTPTPLAIATPTRTPTPTSSVPTNTPSPLPTNTPVPTATPVPNSTKFSSTVFLHGIGKGGDSVNPNGTGNASPVHPSRTLTVELHENGTDNLLFSLPGTVTFNTTNGNFTGMIDGGTNIPTGSYIIKLKAPTYLINAYPGTLSVVNSQTLTLQALSLVAGDANGDNQLNILDYNLLLDCYSELAPPRNCNPTKLLQTDITDDGAVNQFDYNLFLRELSVQSGR